MIEACMPLTVLQKRKISPLVLRLLINTYTMANLANKMGGGGGAQNCAKFSVSKRKSNKAEYSRPYCRVGNYYAGCLAYADDRYNPSCSIYSLKKKSEYVHSLRSEF